MIDQLITALSKEVGLSAEEIADTIWLALHMGEAESISSDFPLSQEDEAGINNGDSKETSPKLQPEISDSQETDRNQTPDEQKAGIYPRTQHQTSTSSDLSFKVPDAPSLREPLTLARALKPLMRRLPSGTTLVLDEAATIQRIADEGLWLPVLKPTLEPWLDLELVVDESISMQIWRHTIRDLERLLKNYGIFRDVRVWGLIADEQEQVQIRRGIGATAKNQPLRSPAELIDPSDRRLVLVVSDCVSSGWRNGKVTSALEIWSKRGVMAIVQMLPKWLWKRTALGRASEVRLQGLIPGVFNQKLIAKEVSLWDELEEDRGIKVPVFTLEPDKVASWAQMLAGRGSIWTLGYVFKLDTTSVNKKSRLFNLDYSQMSAEQRVQAFRVTASPIARKLAGLLAAAPVITLPIVRLIRETLLKNSQQIHVAEVFLGGLLKPLSEINAETNPDYVRYDFIDEVREVFLDSVPSNSVLNVVDEVSKYVAKKVGLSLEDFAALLRTPQQPEDSNIANDVTAFALVTAQVLRRLGGNYARFSDLLDKNFNKEETIAELAYNHLCNLLKEKKWKEADEETARLMFKMADREKEGWLRIEDIEKLPINNLKIIDRLWVEYSNGRFGFSVQKQIYQSLGGTEEFNQEVTQKFWKKVGLLINNQPYWSQYDNLTFDLSAPLGHLPIRYDVQTPSGVLGVVEKLLSRLNFVFYEREILDRIASNNHTETFIRTIQQPPTVISQFQSLIRDKTEGFVGREYVFDAIQTFIQQNPKGYFTIIGDPGMGKSAILAKYVQNTGCIAHFNSQLQGPNRADQFLESVCKQLVARYQLPYDPLPSNATRDGEFLGQLLDEVALKRNGQPVVIVIDALDEVDSGSYRDANILYLPPHLPDGVYFIMTRRRGVEIPFTAYTPLQTISLLDYQIDSQHDVRLYIQNRVDNSEKLRQQINERQETIIVFTDKIVDKSKNNFMYLRYLLQDIEKGLYKDLSLESFPQSLRGYYNFHWQRMGMNAVPLPVAKIKIIYILGEVREPVSRREICEFSGEDERIVQTVLNEWEQFLHKIIKNSENFYSIYSSSFREFLHTKDILLSHRITLSEIHQLIAKNELEG